MKRYDYETWKNEYWKINTRLEKTLIGYTKTSPSWGFQNRILPDNLIYLIVSNSIMYQFSGEDTMGPAEAAPGSCLFIPAGTAHTFVQGNPGTPAVLYHIRFHTRNKKNEAFTLNRQYFSSYSGNCQPWMEQLYRESSFSPSCDFHERFKALLGLIISEVVLQDAALRNYKRGKFAETAPEIINYVYNNPGKRLYPLDLAELAGMELSSFSRKFKQYFGTSPRKWLVASRIRHIQGELVEGRLSITKIAEQYGYPDLFTFSKQFKKYTGLSPREFRTHHSHYILP